MKKILYILFSICLFTACSSDDPISDDDGNSGGTAQNYTSFVVTHESGNYTTKNVVAGYKLSDGTWKRLASYDVTGTNKSKETNLDFNIIKEVTLFCDYTGTDYTNAAIVVANYTIREKKKNVLVIPYMYDGGNIVKKNDNTKYPID